MSTHYKFISNISVLIVLLIVTLNCSAQEQSSETRFFKDVTATHIPIDEKAHALGVALADVNRDGHLDIILALEMQPNRLYLNDGYGKFSWKKNTFIKHHIPETQSNFGRAAENK